MLIEYVNNGNKPGIAKVKARGLGPKRFPKCINCLVYLRKTKVILITEGQQF